MSENAVVSEELLSMLQCPIGKGPLVQQGDYLACPSCGLRYPIREGIPSLVIEHAVLPEGVSTIEELRCDGGEHERDE